MAKAYLSRRYHLSASHRLHAEGLSDAENLTMFGKCNNPHGHGHNYVVEVTVSGLIDPATGMVTNLSDLDAFAQEHLLEPFDHTNLNTQANFADQVPTTENFAVAVHRIFAAYPHAQLERIHMEETLNNSFDYTGSALPRAGWY